MTNEQRKLLLKNAKAIKLAWDNSNLRLLHPTYGDYGLCFLLCRVGANEAKLDYDPFKRIIKDAAINAGCYSGDIDYPIIDGISNPFMIYNSKTKYNRSTVYGENRYKTLCEFIKILEGRNYEI